MKNNVLKLLGLFLLSIFFFSQTFTINAQSVTPCSYEGRLYGCSVYFCGDCAMIACGSHGGSLVCPEEVE